MNGKVFIVSQTEFKGVFGYCLVPEDIGRKLSVSQDEDKWEMLPECSSMEEQGYGPLFNNMRELMAFISENSFTVVGETEISYY
jgi:hypothetical protein